MTGFGGLRKRNFRALRKPSFRALRKPSFRALRKPNFRALRTTNFRLAALYVALFAVSALVLGVAVFLSARSALERQLQARIDSEAHFLAEEYRTGGLDHLLSLVRLRGRGANALDYLVQDGSGRQVAGELPAIAHPRPGFTTIEISAAAESSDDDDDDDGPERERVLVTVLPDGLVLAVGDDLGRVAEVEQAVATAFLWTMGPAALLGIGGGVLLSRAFLDRVDAIARTAEAIIEGDLTRRVKLAGTGDDLDRLAATLNRMLDRIVALLERLREVGSDVAHDLRTPLSRLYQRLEEARAHARSLPDYEAAIEAAMREAESLLEIFSALLRIAQVEGASPRAEFRDLDLSAVAASVVEAFRPDAEEAGHGLVAAIEPGLAIHGDRELLTQAIANLVENALRHTPAGTRVEVDLRAQSGAAIRLAVQDDGPGATAQDLPRLAQRFYRGERSRTTPGQGLGLSLVAAVAELHGGSVQIENMAPGLRVALLFRPTGKPLNGTK